MALLLAVSLVFGVVAWAAEAPPPPANPPQWRINPPVGVMAQARLEPPVGIAPPPPTNPAEWRISPPVGVITQARLGPPVGVTARMQLPGGAPDHLSLFDMIMMWLQSRASIPNG